MLNSWWSKRYQLYENSINWIWEDQENDKYFVGLCSSFYFLFIPDQVAISTPPWIVQRWNPPTSSWQRPPSLLRPWLKKNGSPYLTRQISWARSTVPNSLSFSLSVSCSPSLWRSRRQWPSLGQSGFWIESGRVEVRGGVSRPEPVAGCVGPVNITYLSGRIGHQDS